MVHRDSNLDIQQFIKSSFFEAHSRFPTKEENGFLVSYIKDNLHMWLSEAVEYGKSVKYGRLD